MAVLAIEWQIRQRLEQLDTTNWDQVMDKSYRDFCAYFCEVYIHSVFWP